MFFYTVGVYNASEEEFFNKLVSNGIDTFCDIRQRRGVRGSKYAFVNSKRLQLRLEQLGIRYLHMQGLAPTTAIRDLQRKSDQERGELKSERQALGNVFVTEYERQVLTDFDFNVFLKDLERTGAERVVLFCVEERAAACHRSIVASRLSTGYHCSVTNL
jgi:uncharacterized protein (DUF488 family)